MKKYFTKCRLCGGKIYDNIPAHIFRGWLICEPCFITLARNAQVLAYQFGENEKGDEE